MSRVYSKLKAVEGVNFLAFKKFRVDIKDNIVNFVGYNDSGKSAFLKLVEIILYNTDENDHVHYIHDNEEFFGGSIEFDDGVDIRYYKYRNGKSIWEMYQGDTCLYGNNVDGTILALNGQPKVIADYLQVLRDDITKELVNVRTRSDKLFLVETTGGDNYKILNSVLHSDTLAKAVKSLNKDRNSLQNAVSQNLTHLNILKDELAHTEVLKDEAIVKIRELKEKAKDLKLKENELKEIDSRIEQIEGLEVPKSVSTLDLDKAVSINKVVAVAKQMPVKGVDDLVTVDTVDVSRLKELETITKLKNSINVVQVEEELPELIDISRLDDIKKVGDAYNNLYMATVELQKVNKAYELATNEMKLLSTTHGFKICPTCTTVVN